MIIKYLIKLLVLGTLSLGAAFSFAGNANIQGKTSANVVKDVQVNASGQIVIAPLSLENQTDGLGEIKDGPFNWERVAASDTDEPCGLTGGTGDYLAGLMIYPATTAAGAVSLEDGTGTNYTIHVGGGTTALVSLHPIWVPLWRASLLGAWEVTTGTNVSVDCIGVFAGGNG